jgi:putative ABC transport system permease protein
MKTARMGSLRLSDLLQFSFQALVRQRFRSGMALLSVCIGVSAVLMLTALGEGARRYILHEFSLLGSDVLVMFPGKSETTGGMPPVLGTSQRDITLDDAAQLKQRVVAIKDMAPVVIGSSDVGFGARARTVTVMGANHLFLSIRHLSLLSGKNLSDTDFRTAADECIIGNKLKTALFGNDNAIGNFVRIGAWRFRVVGILDGDTDSFGIDLGDVAVIPVASAQQLFNVNGLFRLLIEIKPEYSLHAAIARIEDVMRQLHNADDVTVNSPDAMLESFDKVLGVIAMGISALGLISLVVAGILIMNITLINVSQRTQEIGLLKALGASSQQVQAIFLMESVLLVGFGTLVGILVGETLVWIGRVTMPSVPFSIPWWAVAFTVVVSLASGVLFAWRPAKTSSALSPVLALQGKQ